MYMESRTHQFFLKTKINDNALDLEMIKPCIENIYKYCIAYTSKLVYYRISIIRKPDEHLKKS